MNARTLTLVFCKATLARPHLWALSALIGNPIHIDIGVGDEAFAVSPHRCIQWGLSEWIQGRRATGTLYDAVTIPDVDIERAREAALTFAVGPMTYLGVAKRVLGKPDICDIDCVAATMLVLKAAGVDPPQRFVEARSLYLWIKSKYPLS